MLTTACGGSKPEEGVVGFKANRWLNCRQKGIRTTRPDTFETCLLATSQRQCHVPRRKKRKKERERERGGGGESKVEGTARWAQVV